MEEVCKDTNAIYQTEARSLSKRESKVTNLNSLEEILAFLQSEDNLLKEKVEMYEKYYQEWKIHEAEMKLCIEQMTTQYSDVQQTLQSERKKVKQLETLKEEHEQLMKTNIHMSGELVQLKKDLAKHMSDRESERKETLQKLKEKDDIIKKYQKDLIDVNERYANEFGINVRSIMENMDLIQRQNMELTRNVNEISTQLQKELTEAKAALDKAVLEKENIVKQNNDHFLLLEIDAKKRKQQDKQNEEKFKAIICLERQNAQLKESNQKMDDEIKRQRQEIDSLTNKNKEYYRNNTELAQKIQEIKMEKEDIGKKNISLSTMNAKLISVTENQTYQSKTQSDELRRAEEQLIFRNKEVNELRKVNEKNNDTIALIKREADILKMEKERLDEENSKLLEAQKNITLELCTFKSRETLQIQLYSSCRGNTLSIVETELTVMLRQKLENESLKLEFIQCAKQSEIQLNVPTLLLCIAASGLETDVANAIQDLTLTNRMALVIFHHKDQHALPSQASERVLAGSKFSCLGGIYDMAFLSTRGIYNCRLTNNNFVSLLHFIRK